MSAEDVATLRALLLLVQAGQQETNAHLVALVEAARQLFIVGCATFFACFVLMLRRR